LDISKKKNLCLSYICGFDNEVETSAFLTSYFRQCRPLLGCVTTGITGAVTGQSSGADNFLSVSAHASPKAVSSATAERKNYCKFLCRQLLRHRLPSPEMAALFYVYFGGLY